MNWQRDDLWWDEGDSAFLIQYGDGLWITLHYQNQTIILLGDFCYSGLLADIAIELNNDRLDINAITSASSNLSTENC